MEHDDHEAPHREPSIGESTGSIRGVWEFGASCPPGAPDPTTEPDPQPRHSSKSPRSTGQILGPGSPGAGQTPQPGQVHDRTSFGRGMWDNAERSSGPLCGLAAELAEAIEAIEGPEGVDDETLTNTVVGLMRLPSMLDSVTAGFVARWDARVLWANDGSKAPGARLGRDVGCRKQTASRAVHTARATRAMSHVSGAWRNGEISTDHVERLTRAATPERAADFAAVEKELVTVAINADWATFERTVAMFETASDDAHSDPSNPDDLARRDKRQRAHRNARATQVGDRWELLGSLDKVSGQIVADTWERINHELWEADLASARATLGPNADPAEITRAAQRLRTSAQRNADALVEMATRAAATPVDAQRPRPLITVVVSAGELLGPIRETFNGLVLNRLEVAQLLFRADFERIVFSPTGQPVNITSPQRFFTGGWRRAVEVRDRHCQHPTCDEPAEYCHVDHITGHCDGGTTSVENGRLLCPSHNHQRPGRRPPPTRRRPPTEDDDPDQPA